MADSLFRISRSGLLRTSANSSSLQQTLTRPLRPENNVTALTETLMDPDDSNRGRSRMDVLFAQFFDILQAHTNETETFEVLLSLSLACKGVVEQLQLEIERGMGGEQGAAHRTASISWLKQEINTWRLLHGIYYDRILLQTDTQADDEMQEGPVLGGSEKMVISQLYAINSTLREYQLVVDWLEACYDQKDPENLLHCHDRMMAWENTLFQLENLQGAAFGKKHEIVKSLDPDAPVREKLSLHALDEEDNMRLGRAIFGAIRRGRIDDALKLCKHYGQAWKAAILEGWRLHEDPNFELSGSLVNEKLPIEGNPRRDVWKRCAWRVADSKRYDEFTRATAGVFAGHLSSLKALLHNNWHDLLWAHIKVQIDIRVESEIRECCTKRYQDMPEDYWNGKMTLEQIFDELNVAKDVSVKDFAKGQLGIIQKHLILDTCGELIQHMVRWLETDAIKLSSHQLRFMAHIVLFLRQIGRVENEKQAEKIIASYVEALLARGDAQLIAYYAAALSNRLQVKLYSQFLETVEQERARELAIDAALQAGLDVEQITRLTVETIRNTQHPLGDLGEPHAGEISAPDQFKIAALEWLIFLPEQRSELLWQACAMMRIYLASNKIECMRKTFLMVPGDVVTRLIATFGSLENLPSREECSLKEYLCYKVYLAGVDSFVEWNRRHQNPPQKPAALVAITSQDNFTNRLVSERKEQTYRIELERWEQKVKEQAKQTTEALYNILMFPEKGWLVDPFISKEPENAAQLNWENRLLQMEKLRSLCLPEIALLLHEVMSKSGDLVGCVRLADEISSEHRQLYKVYTKHKMAELLSKIADTSLELLNSKADPWGYPITA
ncbi:LOW QUALITY PROTEIN: nuclear pore complex protein Nup107 [Drosophila obscura]|uniref:LOW QUALITY PROTEIN: nuclear pore complex protein Nup107 n=1 Tax=Drosophila obscura TaxID=7282 RepID=UPI001BB291C7|nr:LOW QUALITY PROTEIN: nuclear pore complex protein Nup107 [Drosophila obscura]